MANPTYPLEMRALALHRYWIWADKIRDQFRASITDGRFEASQKRVEGLGSKELQVASFFCDDTGLYLSYWYGALYVVAEGWPELKQDDEQIDRLLSDEKLALLKRYRNGTFHFMKNYFDKRFMDYFTEDGTVDYAIELHEAFQRWFRERPRPIEG